MGKYLRILLNERKDIKAKINYINQIVDSSLGKRDYFIRKHKYFWKINDLNKQLKIINSKIEFVINLKSIMEGKNEEQVIKSNCYK